MAWLRLTNEKLQLLEGSRELDRVSTEKLDDDTLALDIPLDWLRASNAPNQMIISLDPPPDSDE
ncbi:MAG: hypothetical protein VKL39_13985 [Leptolyngbyaceae bacterium]|nr:hypothetical protein [Leptolyngbyaceae bacterium]